MDEKYFDKFMNKKCKSMPDKILLDYFRQIIEKREETRQDILQLFTLSVSGDDNTFIVEIQKELEELKDRIKKFSDYFDEIQKRCHRIEKELISRRYELTKVLSSVVEKTGDTELRIDIYNKKTGEFFVVSPFFLKERFCYDTPIKELYLSERLANGLQLYGITVFGELIDRRKNYNIKNFSGIKHLGKKSYLELEKFLDEHKLIDT